MYYSPAKTLRRLYDMQQDLNRNMNDFRADEDELECRGTWIPNIDVKETSEAVVLFAELPGLKKQDIKITVRDKVLSIAGEKVQTEPQEGESFHRVERVYGDFCRQFALPDGVDSTKISAEFVNGVLKLTLPKQEQAKPKEIKITTK